MIVNVKDRNKFKEVINEYFIPNKNNKALHVPSYCLKEDNTEKLYIHNNTIHLSDNLYRFLKSIDLDIEVLNNEIP